MYRATQTMYERDVKVGASNMYDVKLEINSNFGDIINIHACTNTHIIDL